MKTTSLPITLNRLGGEFALPADGWVQLAPYGEIAAPLTAPDGTEVAILQVLDAPTAEAIAAKFRDQAAAPNFPGLLVDFDHFSHDQEKSSRAAGWIHAVEARADGLWGQVKFSASGRTAVEGGDYRLFSPVLGFTPRPYQAGERVRPSVLMRGALTNDPRFKGMVPLSHRDAPFSSEKSTTTKMDYKKALLTLLGLPETSDDASIEAALAPATANMAAGKNYDTVKNRLTTLEAQLVEHDLDKAGLKGAVRTAAQALLTKNREDGLAFITALAADGTYRVTHNRDAGKPGPGGKPEAGADLAGQRDAAVAAYITKNRSTFDAAWNAVRAEKPELFKETSA